MDSVYVIFRQAGGEAKVKEFLLPLSGTSEDYQTICSAIWYGLPAPATIVAIINESQTGRSDTRSVAKMDTFLT